MDIRLRSCHVVTQQAGTMADLGTSDYSKWTHSPVIMATKYISIDKQQKTTVMIYVDVNEKNYRRSIKTPKL